MIEEIIISYLNETLEVPVCAEKPDEPPDKYVLIEKIGSSKVNFIYSATIALQSYAESMYLAAALNEEVKKAMDNIINYTDISKSKLDTDYNYTDTTKKKYRYQAVYEVVY